MNETNELLLYIYQNCKMGNDTLTTLINTIKTKDNKIKKVLESEIKEFEKYIKDSEKLLKKNKVEIKEKGAKYIGTKIDDKLEDEKVQNLINNNIIDVESKKSNLYCLDNSNLEELGLSNIKVDSFYIVDYKQNEVIYVDGIQNSNGETVYKLSDMNKKEE